MRVMKERATFKDYVFGGFLILLPLTIMILVFVWIYNIVASIVEPIIWLAGAKPGIIANMIVLAAVILLCFLIGVFVRTSLGRRLIEFVERNTLYYIPGYQAVKEMLDQFFSFKKGKTPFLSVALVDVYENGNYMTGFITEEQKDHITVFVPTTPNPTSGMIYHVKPKFVKKVDVPVETAFKSVIAGGKGSQKVFEGMEKKKKKK